MSYRAIYAYPWDLAEAGVHEAVDRFLALGLDTVTIAGSYHAGKFLRPHGRGGKVYFPEDGAVYFKPDPKRFGAIKPFPHSMVAAGEDIVGALAAQDRVATNVWLVLLHNSRLGAAHPQATVANAFGDRFVYNLCPSAPEARAYAIGLALDVTQSYPVRRRFDGDAGLPALRARLSSRIRACSPQSLAGFSARALLLRALSRQRQAGRNPR